MRALRWLLFTAGFVCVIGVAWNARWEARLKTREATMILDLRVAPIWSPPVVPSEREFLRAWGQGRAVEEIPGAGPVELSTAWERMLLDLLLCLWPVSLALGLTYLGVRGSRRDLALHLAFHVGIGLTASDAISLGLWLVLGGWGPAFPECLGALGLLGGLALGSRSFSATTAQHGAAADERPQAGARG